MKELAGKTAVVTGGGSGIGRSIALALAEEGVNVVIADLEQADAEAVAEEAAGYGVGSLGVKVDVSKLEDVQALAETAYNQFKSVEILCNNAGVTLRPYRDHWEYGYDDWKWVMQVNFWGVVHGHMVFVPKMIRTPGEKHIVNTSSATTLWTHRGHAAYSASKAAIDGLTHCAREELKPHHIGVSLLHPGAIRTRIVTSDRLRNQHTVFSTALWSDGFAKSEKKGPLSAEEVKQMVDMGVDPDIPSRSNEYITPKYVGKLVVEGIRHNKPFILTHPLPMDRIQARFDELVAGEPVYPKD